ncbi:hypothetical protein BVI434_1590019 [Burkholderia vietnamiensis]|nr:hypothetical protein BVI434_1590019 [Burkholderia vietnamiensis]
MVRRPRHDRLVGQRVAQRVVRDVLRKQDDDPVLPRRVQLARPGEEQVPRDQPRHRPERVPGRAELQRLGVERLRAERQRVHVRQGRPCAEDARELSRRADLAQGPAAVPGRLLVRQRYAEAPVGRAVEGERPGGRPDRRQLRAPDRRAAGHARHAVRHDEEPDDRHAETAAVPEHERVSGPAVDGADHARVRPGARTAHDARAEGHPGADARRRLHGRGRRSERARLLRRELQRRRVERAAHAGQQLDRSGAAREPEERGRAARREQPRAGFALDVDRLGRFAGRDEAASDAELRRHRTDDEGASVAALPGHVQAAQDAGAVTATAALARPVPPHARRRPAFEPSGPAPGPACGARFFARR